MSAKNVSWFSITWRLVEMSKLGKKKSRTEAEQKKMASQLAALARKNAAKKKK